jgi:hypothetical protein
LPGILGLAHKPVTAGPVPAIHGFFANKAWMPGTRSGMTKVKGFLNARQARSE